ASQESHLLPELALWHEAAGVGAYPPLHTSGVGGEEAFGLTVEYARGEVALVRRQVLRAGDDVVDDEGWDYVGAASQRSLDAGIVDKACVLDGAHPDLEALPDGPCGVGVSRDIGACGVGFVTNRF